MSSRDWASRTTAAAVARLGVFAMLHKAHPPGTGQESGQHGHAGGNGVEGPAPVWTGCAGDGGRVCRDWQCRQQVRLGGAFAMVGTARAGSASAQTACVFASRYAAKLTRATRR